MARMNSLIGGIFTIIIGFYLILQFQAVWWIGFLVIAIGIGAIAKYFNM